MNRKRFILLTCAVAFCFAAKAQSSSIVAMEYWIDQKIDDRQPIASAPAQIDINDLSPGFHCISVRVKDDTGLWSAVQTKYFMVLRPESVATSIVKMEYWLDGKINNKEPLSSSKAIIEIDDLSPGIHYISVRSQDDTGLWSGVTTKYFVIARPTIIANSIASMEYWFDGKIGESQTLTNNVAEINIEALSPGFHSISVRSKDDTGIWSSVMTKYFIIPRIVETATITHYCYWFDENTENTTIEASTNPINLLELNLTGLSYYTEHTLYLAVCDSKGAYSTVMEEIFIIEPITTGVESLNGQRDSVKDQKEDWYSLDGKKLNERPTQKGIYIRNGKKIIIK